MNEHIVFGLFSLYVAGISLALVLCGQQDKLLAHLRRFWGRTLGHSLYFLAHVALPTLICVLCLGWGIRMYDTSVASSANLVNLQKALRMEIEAYRSFDQRFLPNKFEEQFWTILAA